MNKKLGLRTKITPLVFILFALTAFGVFSTNIQKARISRNPKTGEKVNTPEKKTIHFKMSKDLFKKLNNEEE